MSKKIIVLTAIILFSSVISIFYQLYIPKSRTKLIMGALHNSSIVKFQDRIYGLVCDTTKEHDFVVYIFSKYSEGCYFSYERNINVIERDINSFMRFGETKISKLANDSVVLFINKIDTLKVVYEIDWNTGVLGNGRKIY